MEIFTKIIETQDLKNILIYVLGANIQQIVFFKDVPDMTWIVFSYQGQSYKLIHHSRSKRFSFEGSLISIQTNDTEFDPEVHGEPIESFLQKILSTLGGMIILGDDILQTSENEELNDAEFLIRRIAIMGGDLMKFNNFLEMELQKLEADKK